MNKVLAGNLYKALKKVKITTISKTPVLNHARLDFADGELLITSTNLEKTFQEKVSCILEEEWSTCVNMVNRVDVSDTRVPRWYKFYPFIDFAKVHAEYKDVLLFSFDEKVQIMTVQVRGEKSKFEFKCIDVAEFPVWKPLEPK